MKIFGHAELCPGSSLEKMMPLLHDEVTLCWQLHKAGQIREVYLRTDEPLAIVALECADVEEARQIMGQFPMVKAGLIEFRFFPVGVFTPFEVLFAGQGWSGPE